MGKKATKICKEKGIVPKKVPDEHYYQINSYPLSVLVEMWKGFDDLLI
ncbi:hypothetical protein GM3708_1326 [Geminocystis sp. NIES-3708]|nr:hypothetical protein GM3708_1326 [Geminocystis sp. NIES-3708]